MRREGSILNSASRKSYTGAMLTLLLSASAFAAPTADRASCTVPGVTEPFLPASLYTEGSFSEFGALPTAVEDHSFSLLTQGGHAAGTLFVAGYRPARVSWTRGESCTVALVA